MTLCSLEERNRIQLRCQTWSVKDELTYSRDCRSVERWLLMQLAVWWWWSKMIALIFADSVYWRILFVLGNRVKVSLSAVEAVAAAANIDHRALATSLLSATATHQPSSIRLVWHRVCVCASFLCRAEQRARYHGPNPSEEWHNEKQTKEYKINSKQVERLLYRKVRYEIIWSSCLWQQLDRGTFSIL